MLFLKIRVDVEEKLVRKFNIVNFLEYFSFFLSGLVFITFPLFYKKIDQKKNEELKEKNGSQKRNGIKKSYIYILCIFQNPVDRN